MSIISYIPSIVSVASNVIPSTVESTTLINGNLPIIEDGFIVGEAVEHSNVAGEWFISGIVWLGKTVIGFIATQGASLDPIFVLVSIVGIFCMMGGLKKLGTKLTSGSILGYIACKVVSDVCQ